MLKKIGVGFFVIFLFFNAYAVKQTVSVETKGNSEVFDFARQELIRFLSGRYELKDSNAHWQIVLNHLPESV